MDRVINTLKKWQTELEEMDMDLLLTKGDRKNLTQAIQDVKSNRFDYLYGENGILLDT